MPQPTIIKLIQDLITKQIQDHWVLSYGKLTTCNKKKIDESTSRHINLSIYNHQLP